MTREGQYLESDGRICIGGEWLDLHPATEPDLTDPAVLWAQFRWRHDWLIEADGRINNHPYPESF